jgi:Fe-S oxidoreductase
MDWNHPASEIYLWFPGYYMAWAILIFGLAGFFFTMFKRLRLIRQGRPDPRFSDIRKRILDLLKDGILQRRHPRYLFAGVLHIVIFWGFVIFGLHSIDLVAGGLRPGYALPLMEGLIGTAYATVKDFFVLIVLAACIMALYRRVVLRPKRYQDSHQLEAYVVLCLIAFLMISDMFYEGSKLFFVHPGPGFLVAAESVKSVLSGARPESLKMVNQMSYWLHLLSFFFFLNLLPLSKHFHIVTALPNVFFKKINRGAVKPPRWDEYDIARLDQAGVRTYHDFTWKHILDSFTCTECGRCTDNCPANAVGQPLSPKIISMKLRDIGYKKSALFLKDNLKSAVIPGDIIPDEAFWSCTTCGACEEECPVFIEYIDKIVELRRRRVLMESTFPPEIEQIYRNMEIYGNAWGSGSASRLDWARGLNIKNVQNDPGIEVLYWVGCAAAYDDRSRQSATSFIRILQKAGINFAILGTEENCCGDYARRTGNEYLFQILAKKNIETLRKYDIHTIVATCPHGYNTLKNEYPQLGGNFDVIHATEFILGLIEEGRLSFSKASNKTVTYHDPCYLGRHNGIYEIPRKILDRVPGITMLESEKSKDRSFCCGAGGGHFWMQSSGQRVNDARTDQLLEKSPEILITGCPYCLIMLEDGIESKEMKGQVIVKDIAEIVSEVI